MINLKSPLLLLSLLLGLSAFAACATTFTLSSEPIEGVVREEGTDKPVPEAIVVVRWQGHLGYTGTVCYHAETTTTNAEGKYRIPAWSKPSPYGNISDRTWLSWAHKPGYQYARVQRTKRIDILQPFIGGREERLKYLRRANGATSCGSAGESEKNLYPLRKAIYEEAKQIAKTDFEKYVAAGFEHYANSLLLPPDKRISLSYPQRVKSELLKAIEDNNIPRAKTLLASGADPNDRANDGATMLMTGIRYGSSEMTILLLENGADPNATTFDDQNLTAMDQLIYRNQDRAVAYSGKIAALMIQKGYNVNHRDVSGRTALEKAMQYGARSAEKNVEIIKVLKEHAAGDK